MLYDVSIKSCLHEKKKTLKKWQGSYASSVVLVIHAVLTNTRHSTVWYDSKKILVFSYHQSYYKNPSEICLLHWHNLQFIGVEYSTGAVDQSWTRIMVRCIYSLVERMSSLLSKWAERHWSLNGSSLWWGPLQREEKKLLCPPCERQTDLVALVWHWGEGILRETISCLSPTFFALISCFCTIVLHFNSTYNQCYTVRASVF